LHDGSFVFGTRRGGVVILNEPGEILQHLESKNPLIHPIILLTAKAASESKIEGLETGADDYLVKPFDSRELLARVKNLIAQRRKLRERFSREVVALKPSAIAVTPMDEQFLNRVKEIVEKHLGEEEFSVEDFAPEVGMSRVQLHRKLKALTNQSAGEFMLAMRHALCPLRKKKRPESEDPGPLGCEGEPQSLQA